MRLLYPEHFFLQPAFIRTALRVTGLYERGQRNAEAVVLRRNVVQLSSVPSQFHGFGLEAMGIRLLLNESEALVRDDHRIFLAGIDDDHYFRTGDVTRAAAQIPPGACSILLSHTPEVFRDAAQAGFNLLLSGHTHGG